MKTNKDLLLCFLVLTAACTSQPASPATAVANTPPATAVPDPTELPKPTPTPITVTETELDACREIVEAKISSDGVLNILFKSSDYYPSNSIISEFGFSDSRQRSSSAIWSEDTQTAALFPLAPGAFDPKVSSDQRWILFRHDTTETQSEFWVIGMDGKDAKKLDTVRLNDDIRKKYRGSLFSLDYGWIPNTETFFKEILPDVTHLPNGSPAGGGWFLPCALDRVLRDGEL